jgi:hypothetical protein
MNTNEINIQKNKLFFNMFKQIFAFYKIHLGLYVHQLKLLQRKVDYFLFYLSPKHLF